MPLLGIEHFIFGTLGTFTFLPPDLGDSLSLRAFPPQDLRLQLFRQHPACPVPVHGLGAFLLAFDEKTRGLVLQDNACGDFVDILASGPSEARMSTKSPHALS